MKGNNENWCELTPNHHLQQAKELSPMQVLCAEFPCESLDRITRLAQEVLDVPYCFITLLQRSEQQIVSRAGNVPFNESDFISTHSYPLQTHLGKQIGTFHICDPRKHQGNGQKQSHVQPFIQLMIRELELQSVIVNQQETRMELQAIKQQYTTIVNNIKEVIFQADMQGRWTFLNPAWLNLTGFLPEYTLGKHMFAFFRHADSFVEKFLDLIQGKDERFQMELQLATKGTRWKWVELSISPTIDEQRIIVGISGTITDITERKQVELYLEESEQLYKSLFEQNKDAVFAIDTTGVFTSINQTATEITGYSYDELIGRPFYTLIGDQRLRMISDFFSRTLRGEAHEFETDFMHKEGNSVLVSVKTSPIVVNQKIIGAFVVTKDITRERAADLILKRTMQELADLKLALDESSLVTITNENGIIIYINDIFCKVSKYNRDELIGQHVSIIDSKEYAPEFFSEVDRMISQGVVWKGEIQNADKYGTPFWTETTIVPFLDEKRRPYQYVTVKHDITARKTAEERFWDELELAKKVQRSILTPPIHHEKLTIDAIYEPSEQLSGDLYSWYQIDSHRFGAIILDVMGHGVSASLVIMSIRALLRGLITRVVDPLQVMEELNQHINNLFKDEEQPLITFVTGIYLLIDLKNQTIEYVNAGHPSGFFLADQEIIPLDVGGIPLGVLTDIQLRKEKINIMHGCRIFLYTDGLSDSLHASPIASKAKLEQILSENEHSDHSTLFEAMITTKKRQTNMIDDICMICITVKRQFGGKEEGL